MASKDSKDVKSPLPKSTGTVLPASVQSSATSSVTRTRRHKKHVIVVSSDDDVSDLETAGSDEEPVSALDSKSSRKNGNMAPPQGSVAPPKGDPVLPEVAVSDAQLEQFLLREIYARRGGRHEGSLAEHKHYYTVTGASAFTASGTEIAIAPANIVAGTSVSTRLTNTVKLRQLRIHFIFSRNLQAIATTQNVIMPAIHCCVFRDKTPAVVGTAPGIHGTDANPPASSSLIFSRLGAAQSVEADRTMVRNPITEDLYHVYDYRQFHFNNEQNFTGTTVTTQVCPTQYIHHSLNFDLNDVKQVYAPSSANATTNPIYIVLWSDFVDNSANGFVHNYRCVTDLEFYDVQDD